MACLQNRSVSFDEKLELMGQGIGDKNIVTMILIFLAAGIFVGVTGRSSAEAVAYFLLSIAPVKLAVAVLFVVACFVSMAMGTSVGTITLLAPIAVAVSASSGFDLPLCIASVMGGAMFGDNLSFISDTTIAACSTQGTEMKDKFRANFKIALPAALAALADPAAFARRWPAAKGQQPMVLAVGDGNHSLATAKAYWEELKPTLSEEQRRTHPARWCLAEVCNVHSPAIEIEPIHRVVFGVGAKELYAALDAWDQQQGSSTTMSDQRLRLADAHGESAVALANPPAPLTVGSVEAFLADFLPAHPGVTVDYIHGESTALALASDPARPATAILLPDFAKADLFKGVVLGGVLPRKTFSMGHAEEKRYYNECRVIGV